ncbi:methionyl-tRNA formyltransferase [Apibacter sp. HY039]|uniref:methionyl-tRNA formyltransferase n=1 Tax=Apibacter sp. HY039 TaxID=2501476 RepID=UPI000FEB8258|nr:methionyl-tRNA formyltransferase [Apibacter sp. HY039]
MNKKSLKVLYMGTPDFAVAPLDEIFKSNHQIVGVVTVPDKPAGRGRKLMESAVKKYAVENELLVLQPSKMKDPDFLKVIKDLNPDVIVVVAFRLLPEEIWSLPQLGTFNLHASLLPQYRGAAPINFAIINGDKESGVTTFFIDNKIDTGEILLQSSLPILDSDDAGTLHDKLMELGRGVVLETLNGLAAGTLEPKKQVLLENVEYKYAPKIFKDDCEIDWNKSLIQINNLIKGLSPYPVAFTHWVSNDSSKILKIYKGLYTVEKHALPVGSVVVEGKALKIAASDGFYFPLLVQLEGKKVLSVSDFINGLTQKNNIKVR